MSAHLDRIRTRRQRLGGGRIGAPVTQERIDIAKAYGIEPFSVDVSAEVCRLPDVNLPFWASMTLSEIESPGLGFKGGANIYGHDRGGVYSDPNGLSIKVTPRNYHDFIIKVMNGAISNGVGPRQITYAGSLVRCTGGNGRNGGYFRVMAEMGLLPWRVYDNIYFGDMVFADHRDNNSGSYWTAARDYNGKTSYADKWVTLARGWIDRLHIKGDPLG